MDMLRGKHLLSVVFAILLISCSNDDAISNGGNNQLGTVEYEIDKIEDFTARELAVKVFGTGENWGTGIDVASVFLNTVAAREQQLQKELGIDSLQLGYRKINYLYNSVDHLGNSVKLSSTLYWNRYKVGDEWHDVAPDNICLIEHFTITSDAECPTRSFQVEPHLAGNALVVMPDYLGYGYTADKFHPYLNQSVAAVNSLDALDAAYGICRDYTQGLLDGDWTMCVIGASQGGSNALAVHKYLDTHPALADKWNFTHSNCAAGAYSPARTFATYMQWEMLEYPVVLPLVLKSMIVSNPDIMSQWSEEQFYSAEYLKIKPQVDAMLQGKMHTTSEINAVFFEHFATPDAPSRVNIKDILSAQAQDSDSDMSKALFQAFDRNDLTKGWIPKRPVKLYHSKGDRVVPFENAMDALSAFGTMATLQTTENDGHVASCAMWMFSIFLLGL